MYVCVCVCVCVNIIFESPQVLLLFFQNILYLHPGVVGLQNQLAGYILNIPK